MQSHKLYNLYRIPYKTLTAEYNIIMNDWQVCNSSFWFYYSEITRNQVSEVIWVYDFFVY